MNWWVLCCFYFILENITDQISRLRKQINELKKIIGEYFNNI